MVEYYVGMDHGTTAVSFEILDENQKEVAHLTLPRDKLANNEVSFKEELTNTIDIEKIKLLCMCYGMGDGINEITPLKDVKNNAIQSLKGAGKVTGGGSQVYKEIEELDIPAILIPGLHRDCEFLDPRFRASYSHCASAEKVSLSYYAYKKTGWKNMIIADISSNSVCILVEDDIIKGAMDACIGAMGFIHGPLDLSMLRDIDENRKTANECFSHAGVSKIAKVNTKVVDTKDEIIKKAVNNDENALLAIDSLVMSVVMEIYGLYGIMNNPIDGIILTGSAGVMHDPIDISKMIEKKIEKLAQVKVLTSKSGAIGSAMIAYDIINENKNSILGINVKKRKLKKEG